MSWNVQINFPAEIEEIHSERSVAFWVIAVVRCVVSGRKLKSGRVHYTEYNKTQSHVILELYTWLGCENLGDKYENWVGIFHYYSSNKKNYVMNWMIFV